MLEAILEVANMITVDATQWMVLGGTLKFIELANMVDGSGWCGVGGCKCSLMLSHCRCYAMDRVAGGKMNADRTCTHGRWDGVGWMLAVLEPATVLELAHVHEVLAMQMG